MLAGRHVLARTVVVIVTALTVAGGGAEAATTFVVTSTVDAVDALPGDGVCATAAGPCTLRAAVQEANALAGPETITLSAAAYTLTLDGFDEVAAVGDLDIRTDIALLGAGAAATVIDASALENDRALDSFPCFQCPSNVVRIENLTVTGGHGNPGGGIVNGGHMTLDHVVVRGNANVTDGGGILNGGTLRLAASSVVENSAANSGGGIINTLGGGPTLDRGRLIIEDSFIDENSARDGGGLYNGGFSLEQSGSISISNSSISHNQIDFCGFGGGVFNNGFADLAHMKIEGNNGGCSGGGIQNGGRGTLDLTHSTVSGNRSRDGGGITNFGTASITATTLSANEAADAFGGAILAFGTVTVVNSTFSGNRAVVGGAIRARFARVTIVNTTIAGNVAVQTVGSSFPHRGGGIYLEEGASVALRSTILDGNLDEGVPSNCDDDGTVAATSLGHNLEDASTCGFSAAGDLTALDALLGPLTDNGGPTQTHPLRPGSPAIDAGDDSACPSADQRAVHRPQGPHCDIGAFELEPGRVERVDIDVKDGAVNCRNPHAIITVAVLTTASFDASDLDASSLRLDGAAEVHGKAHLQDADADGDLDVVLHFQLGDTTLDCASTEATLTGETFAGQRVEGSDAVNLKTSDGRH